MPGIPVGYPTSGSFGPYANFHYFTGSNLGRYREKLYGVIKGTSHCRVLCVGDSTMAGWGAGGVGSGSGQYVNAFTNQAAALMAAAGVNTSTENFFGDRNFTQAGGSVTTFDTRLTLGTGWSAASGTASLGGRLLQASAGAGNLSFAPTTNCDTFEIYYAVNTGFGVFGYAFNGGAQAGTVNTSGTGGVGKSVVTTALGANTLNITPTSGTVSIVGVIAYNSTVKTVQIVNVGAGGFKTADWIDVTNGWSPGNAAPTMGQDLTVIDLTINDPYNGVSNSTYSANLQTLTNLFAGTDVLFMSGNAVNTTAVTSVNQAATVSSMSSTASGNGMPFVDIYSILGDWATLNANGNMFDSLHPDTSGYALIAAQIKAALLQPGMVSA